MLENNLTKFVLFELCVPVLLYEYFFNHKRIRRIIFVHVGIRIQRYNGYNNVCVSNSGKETCTGLRVAGAPLCMSVLS